MTPVTVQSGGSTAGGSGGTGWSAQGLFVADVVTCPQAMTLVPSSFTLQSSGNSFNAAHAQSFTPSTSGEVRSLYLDLNASGGPTDNLTVTIQTDASGAPSGTILATSSTRNAATLPTSTSLKGMVSFMFPAPASLSGGTTYWIVLQRSGSSGTINVNYGTPGYSGGNRSVYSGTSNTWTAASGDDLSFIAPVSGSGSRLYQIVQDTGGSPKIHVYKSTDDGATWAEQDSSHAPAVSNGSYPWTAKQGLAQEIAVSYFTATNTVSTRIFDPATDTWAASIYTANTQATYVDNASPIRLSFLATGRVHRFYLSYNVDNTDLYYTYSTGTNWVAQSVVAATSADRSTIVDVVTDPLAGRDYAFWYDGQTDVFATMSAEASNTNGTVTTLDSTAATTQASHVSANFQPYLNGSGVLSVLAAYIDADDTLQERSVTITATSASATIGTQHQVSSSTSYAGRQLSTCKYGSDLYVFASTATGIDYWKDTGASGTWSSVTNWKTGLTSAALSQALSVPGVGILVSYMDGGNVVIDWAVDGPSGGGSDVTVNGTTATATASANAGTVSIPRTVNGTTSTTTGAANVATPRNAVTGLTGTATGTANAGTVARTIPGTSATATGAANAGAPSYAATPSGTTATASAAANTGTIQAGATIPGTTATATATANAGALSYAATATGTTATAAATANAGTVQAGASVTGTTATVSASASAGTLTYGANVTGNTAAAIGSAYAGTLSYAVTINGATATVAASANAGTLSYGATVTGQTATVAVIAGLGSIAIGATVAGTTATATITANTGSITVAPIVAGQTATASATATSAAPAITRTGTTATAQAFAVAGSVVTGTAATVSGATATITIDAYAGTTAQVVIAGRLSATLSHRTALSASVGHRETLDATVDHHRALSARLEHV